MIFRSFRGFFRRSRWVGAVRRVIAARAFRRIAGVAAAIAVASALAHRLTPPDARVALLANARQALAGRTPTAAIVFGSIGGAGVFIAAFLRSDFWGRVLLLLGLGAFLIEAMALAPNPFSGHADFSGYAEMAQSLIQRRGLEVDYVSWYFRAYERLPRPEDHWPPFYSFLIAPFYIALGRCALAVRLPGALAACLLLPTAVRSVAMRLSRSPTAGFAAGLHALLYPAFLRFTFSAPFDIVSAWITTLAVALAVKGFDRPRAFIWMGLAGGLAGYAKGNGILLLPLFAGLYVLARSFWPAPGVEATPPAPWLRSRRLPLGLAVFLALAFIYRPVVGLAVLPAAVWLGLCGCLYRRGRGGVRRAMDRDFLAGLAVWVAVVTPWAARNIRFFGDPFYSTQSHVPAYIGRKGWEEGTYPLYWGRPPRMAERFDDRVAYWNMTRRFARQYFWWIFMDTAERGEGRSAPPDRNAPPMTEPLWKAVGRVVAASFRGADDGQPYTWSAGLTAIAGIIFVGVLSAARMVATIIRWLVRRFRRRGTGVAEDAVADAPSDARDGAANPSPATFHAALPGWNDPRWLWPPIIGGALTAFLIFLWEPLHRLESPSIALMLAGAWAFFAVVVRGLVRLMMRALPRHWRRLRAPAAATAVFALAASLAIAHAQTALWPHRLAAAGKASAEHLSWIEVGLWMAEHLKDSVTMTRNPWQLHFYSQQFAVQIPLASAEDVIAVMRRFGVTHVIPDHRRPALIALMRLHARAFPLVFRSGPVFLHEVQYDALPPALRDIPPIPMPERREP